MNSYLSIIPCVSLLLELFNLAIVVCFLGFALISSNDWAAPKVKSGQNDTKIITLLLVPRFSLIHHALCSSLFSAVPDVSQLASTSQRLRDRTFYRLWSLFSEPPTSSVDNNIWTTTKELRERCEKNKFSDNSQQSIDVVCCKKTAWNQIKSVTTDGSRVEGFESHSTNLIVLSGVKAIPVLNNTLLRDVLNVWQINCGSNSQKTIQLNNKWIRSLKIPVRWSKWNKIQRMHERTHITSLNL